MFGVILFAITVTALGFTAAYGLIIVGDMIEAKKTENK